MEQVAARSVIPQFPHQSFFIDLLLYNGSGSIRPQKTLRVDNLKLLVSF